jgi:hypothetical protein
MCHQLQAIFLTLSSRKGIRNIQRHRTLGCTIKIAWFISHRLREAKRLTYAKYNILRTSLERG